MQEFIRKITSRKLWLAIAGVATGILAALGGETSDIQVVAGLVTALVSAVAYIRTEGQVDAARVATGVETAKAAIAAISCADTPTAEVTTEVTTDD